MNGKVAKRLRKQASYEKTKNIKVIGYYNINLGYRILNVPKTEPAELSETEKTNKSNYKTLKKEYKSN